MKRFGLLLAASCLSVWQMPAQTNERALKLTGIISLPDFKCALLEIQASRGQWINHTILHEGQSEEGVEVSKIDPSRETVEVSCDGTARTLSFAGSETEGAISNEITGAHPTIHLHKLGSPEALFLYGELVERNLLPEAIKRVPISLRSAAADKSEAGKALAEAFQQQGIALVFEGEKFVIVAPEGQTNRLKQLSEEVRANISKDGGSWTNAGVIRAGAIKFINAPAGEVLAIYASYSGRRFANQDIADPGTMTRMITFSNSTPLTRAEVGYALEMMLTRNGIRIVRNEDGSFNALPVVRSGTKP